jgi:hypothetical protein
MNNFLNEEGCEQKCQHTRELDAYGHKGRTYQLTQVNTTKHKEKYQIF